MRVMGFEAHPDDLDVFYAGTMAKYAAMGHEVAVVCVTNGEVGHPTLPKAEIAAIRHQETLNSCAVIGARLYWLGYPDEFLFNCEEVRRRFIHTIRDFRPDIIITLDKDLDYHPDHTAVGQIVWDTHVMVTVPNIETGNPPCEVIPEIYFSDTSAGIGFIPEFYVNIDDTWEKKKAMAACHASQDVWTNNQYGETFTMTNCARVLSEFRGLQAGCRYAECFRKPKFFPQYAPRNGLPGVF